MSNPQQFLQKNKRKSYTFKIIKYDFRLKENKMNKTQELKERIYKHCPELKELNFGCEVGYTLRKRSHWHRVVYKEGQYVWIVTSLLGGDTWNGTTKKVHVNDLNRIHAKPIHLEHVLRAINLSVFNEMYSIDVDGRIQDLNNENIYIDYDLTKTFDQNCTDNPELVEFLLEVIK